MDVKATAPVARVGVAPPPAKEATPAVAPPIVPPSSIPVAVEVQVRAVEAPLATVDVKATLPTAGVGVAPPPVSWATPAPLPVSVIEPDAPPAPDTVMPPAPTRVIAPVAGATTVPPPTLDTPVPPARGATGVQEPGVAEGAGFVGAPAGTAVIQIKVPVGVARDPTLTTAPTA